MTIFSTGTRQLITDAAINAVDNGRAAGMPDHATREEFVRAAGVAFDAITDDREDADPDGSADEADRPEFLG
jgi:hypothetical protein